MLTFNEFLLTLGFRNVYEVDEANAVHEVVGKWLDYVNNNKQ